jgi:acyl-CoA thioesterase
VAEQTKGSCKLDEIHSLIEKGDRLIQLFGMEIIDFGPGRASVRMTVGENHVNAARLCHGGTMFSLADVAFALASNSHGNLALAVDMSISFLRSVPPGEIITAACVEKNRGKTLGTYQIEIKDSKARLVALLKATAFVTEDHLEKNAAEDTVR